MGIDLQCVYETLSCSYSTWHKIRIIISKAVILYMQSKQEFININNETPLSFDDYFELFITNYDLLENYDVEGIYFLLAVPDSLGIFHSDNSVLIMKMMNVIENYMPKDMPFYEQFIKLFEESVLSKHYIYVS